VRVRGLLRALADAFYTAIHDALAKDYQIVTAPGPGVLQVQVALTEAQASYPTLDTISTIVPQSLLLSQTMGLATGKPSCLG
jgi:hypothetical protein